MLHSNSSSSFFVTCVGRKGAGKKATMVWVFFTTTRDGGFWMVHHASNQSLRGARISGAPG